MKLIMIGKLRLAGSLLAISLVAAGEKEGGMGRMGSMGSGMTLMDMMGKSNMSCMATHDSLDALSKEIQDAIKADDKAKMKAALQKADGHFAQMKSNMSMCMNMMNMMGGMMGGGKSDEGMGMGGKMPREAKPAAPEKHEKHHPK